MHPRPDPDRCRSRPRGPDRGQAAPLVAGLLVVAAVLLLAVVPLARGAQERARAQTAADAAALAGAAGGEEEARAVAAANGATLVDLRRVGPDVWVEVRLGSARAEARAQLDPWPDLPTPS